MIRLRALNYPVLTTALFIIAFSHAAAGCDSAFSGLAPNPSDSDADKEESDGEESGYSMLITPTWGNQGSSVKILGELLELPQEIKKAFQENPFVYVAERNFGAGIHFKEWRVTASPAGFSATILIDDTAPPALRNVWVDFVAGDFELKGQGAFYVLSSQRDGDSDAAGENYSEGDEQDASSFDGETSETNAEEDDLRADETAYEEETASKEEVGELPLE